MVDDSPNAIGVVLHSNDCPVDWIAEGVAHDALDADVSLKDVMD